MLGNLGRFIADPRATSWIVGDADASLGSILICGLAIVISAFLFIRSERKKAAVGRRFVIRLASVPLSPHMLILLV